MAAVVSSAVSTITSSKTAQPDYPRTVSIIIAIALSHPLLLGADIFLFHHGLAPVSSAVLGIVAPDAGDAGADEDDFHALRRRTHQVVRQERAQERAEKITRRPAPVAGPNSSTGPSIPFISRDAGPVAAKKAKVVTF